MDFGDIIRRAWRISWRHKALWVLGLFAGATGGGFGGWGGTGYRFDADSLGSSTSSWPGFERHLSDASVYLQEWAPVIVASLVLLFLLGVLWTVLSVAAQAGLAYEVEEAEQDRPVSARAGWAAGFHYWGRVVVVALLLMLPISVLGLAVAALAAFSIVAVLSGPGEFVTGLLAVFAAVGLLLGPVLVVLGFAFSNMYVLAVRFIAIEDRTATDALAASWQALRHRFKDVLLMWLVMLVLGVGFGIVVAVPAGIAGVAGVLAAGFGIWPVAVLLGLALLVVVTVLGAFWGTFTSAAWTLFFRALTGRDTAGVWPAAESGYLPPPPIAPGPPVAPPPPAAPPQPPATPAP